MKYTTNKNFKLPEYTDIADVADLNENFEAIDEHLGETVASENGAHGFRYDEENQKLEAKTSTGEWEEISLGADVSGVTATAGKVLKGSKFVTADGVLTDGAMADYSGETVTSNGWSFNSSGVNFNITNSGYYDKDSSYIFESYASMGLSADKIAEGEIVLGLTGTHAGGLKVVTGSVSLSLTSSSADCPKVTISSPGINTKYALFEIVPSATSASNKAMIWYDLTNIFNTFEVPTFSYNGLYAYVNGWHGKPYSNTITTAYNCVNTADSLSIPFCYIPVGTSSFSWTPVINYTLFGE